MKVMYDTALAGGKNKKDIHFYTLSVTLFLTKHYSPAGLLIRGVKRKNYAFFITRHNQYEDNLRHNVGKHGLAATLVIRVSDNANSPRITWR